MFLLGAPNPLFLSKKSNQIKDQDLFHVSSYKEHTGYIVQE